MTQRYVILSQSNMKKSSNEGTLAPRDPKDSEHELFSRGYASILSRLCLSHRKNFTFVSDCVRSTYSSPRSRNGICELVIGPLSRFHCEQLSPLA